MNELLPRALVGGYRVLPLWVIREANAAAAVQPDGANGEGNDMDTWGRFTAVSGFLAAVLVPISVTLVGHWYTSAIADRETVLKEQQFAREWVQLSLEILREPGVAEQERLNQWAVRVMNHYLPDAIHIREELRDDLAAGRTRIPEVRSEAGRVERMEALQNEALLALLDRDIDGAIAQLEVAHREWHDFRTVWEMLRFLRERRAVLAGSADDQAWKDLYRELHRRMDMRGVPDDVRARLRP